MALHTKGKKVNLDKFKHRISKLKLAMEFNVNWLATEMNAEGILSDDNRGTVCNVKTTLEPAEKVELMLSDFMTKVKLDSDNVSKLVDIMKQKSKEYKEAIEFLEEINSGECGDPNNPLDKYKTFDNFTTGRNIQLKGVAPNSGRIAVNIFNAHKPDDIIFHFNPRFDERCVVRNSRLEGAWGPEERDGGMVFTPGKEFSLSIIVEPNVFRVLVDDKFFCEYHHRCEVPNTVLLEFDCDIKSS